MFRIRETREVERKFDAYLRNDKDKEETLNVADADRVLELANAMAFIDGLFDKK